jgi:hypothetical protein
MGVRCETAEAYSQHILVMFRSHILLLSSQSYVLHIVHSSSSTAPLPEHNANERPDNINHLEAFDELFRNSFGRPRVCAVPYHSPQSPIWSHGHVAQSSLSQRQLSMYVRRRISLTRAAASTISSPLRLTAVR